MMEKSSSPPKTQTLDPGETFAPLERALERFGHQKDALLEVLHATQEAYGHISPAAMHFISEQLNLPLAHVYSVATFFHMFTLEPGAKKRCLVCTDPACQIAGAEQVVDAAQQYAASELGGAVHVERANCLGLCDQAPVALYNDTAYVDLRPELAAALLAGQAHSSRLQVSGEPRILTSRIGRLPPLDLAAHRADGAFQALEKALVEMSPEVIIEQVKASGLSGRGGAGFPTGMKWEYTRQAPGTPKYVVCNFDESEPGTFKDRVLMEGDPYRTIEGIMLCGYAIGAQEGYIFIRGEYPEAARVVQAAIDQLYAAGLLGKQILGSTFSFDLKIRRSAGAYICGEETALFEAIEGNRGNPRHKPPFPTTAGLFGKPTAINNVETLAIIPELVQHGGAWLRQWGSQKSIGLKLFCLSGHVQRPGVVEAPYGLTVRELIERFGGGFIGEPQAVLMGGAAGGLLHPQYLDTPLTHEALNPLGTPIGSGVVMVINQDVSLLQVLKTLARFFINETCGQCVTCRVGTTQVYHYLDKIASGNAKNDDINKLEHLLDLMRSVGECGLGQTAPNPIRTALNHFRTTLVVENQTA